MRRRGGRMRTGTGLLALLLTFTAQGAAQELDILIRGGLVVDGTGNPAYRADIGIRGTTIVRIGPDLQGEGARRVIDATGLHVSPGFIDIHSHADRVLAGSNAELRKALPDLRQGISTVVGAPDGRNRRFPLTAEIEAFRSQGLGLNVVPMIGHGTVREEVMGDDYERYATPEEVGRMMRLVRDAMEAGAWGLSTGFEYRPGRFSHPDEAVELAKVVAEFDGFHFSHMRGAGLLPKWQVPSMVDGWPVDGLQGIQEVVRIAREAGIRSVASHVKAKGRLAWGRALNDILLVERARAEGLQVYMDQYPYEGHSGSPAEVTPLWALVDPGVDTSGGLDSPVYDVPGAFARSRENLRRNLADPKTRELLRVDTEFSIDYNGGAERIIVTGYPDSGIVGLTVAEVARRWGLTPEETIWEFALSGLPGEPQGALMRPLSLHRSDVDLYMQQEYTATSSDGTLTSGPGLHPRNFGAFARKIGHYVREREVISLPFAIRSSTGLPAQIVGLTDRGYLREGYRADIVVFDFQRYGDRATPLEPELQAEGVEFMFVNGTLAIDGGVPTGAMAGEVILKTGPRLEASR